MARKCIRYGKWVYLDDSDKVERQAKKEKEAVRPKVEDEPDSGERDSEDQPQD